MRFEKITENKIRITFNMDDLSEKNIDFHSFMANSDDTQALFLDMLNMAEKEIGFVTKDYKLMIEALATSDGNFVLTVTRSLPEATKPTVKRIKGKKKNLDNIYNYAVFTFDNFDDLCSACNCFNDDFIKLINKSITDSKLYLYNDIYYLILTVSNNSNEIKNLCYTLAEFGGYKKYSKTFENRLIEYGNLIIKAKVFNKIKKNFS